MTFSETQAAEQAHEAAGSAADTAAPDWRAGIGDERLREFAGRFETPADVVKTAFEFRQKLSNAVTVPGKDADPEEVRAFQRRLGVPETPDGYADGLPEEAEAALAADPEGAERQRRFLAAMHGAGAPPAAVRAAIDWYLQETGEAAGAAERVAAEATDTATAELRRAWGGQYGRKVELARRAAAAYGGEDLAALLDGAAAGGVPLGSHPAFVRAFAAVGEAMTEDRPLGGAGAGGGEEPMRRLDSLTAEIHDAQARGDRTAVDRLSAERAAIADRLFGTGPIVGSEGRQA